LETAPKPSRAERKAAKKKEKEQRSRERERALAKEQTGKAEKRRNPILAFFISCWAELKKVQWPDRDTLVQASAVTLIFVVVMAAYLGGLDAIFNWLVKQIL
ncbi:MAG: preprotein translocase subunit SecE, partial [Actinomycetota bacterium]|nr:preprotein translocase subunit SecE [Actinomycetota bacterium]